MPSKPDMYDVVINHRGVEIKRLPPDHRSYKRAVKNVIYRERDAIVMLRKKEQEDNSDLGTYSFQSLENAKSFALLHLKWVEEKLATNMDLIQAYSGDNARSGAPPA